MTENGTIATEQVSACLACGVLGRGLYGDLEDRLFCAPGRWGFLQCPICGMAWLNPRPRIEELQKAYRTYYTHEERSTFGSLRAKIRRGIFAAVEGYESLADGVFLSLAGRVLCALPQFRERARMGTMCLEGAEKGRLLDVGCGSGEFLSLMRDAGWDVVGVEPDANAARLAMQRGGVPTFVGALEAANFPDESFDAITLKHVIEHVHDPVGLLSTCRRLLKPNGRVIAATPNIRSFGHEMFGDCWRGLEPPRHLHVFSLAALRICFERANLHVEKERTSAQGASWTWAESMAIKRSNGTAGRPSRKGGVRSLSRFFLRLSPGGLMLQIREQISQHSRGEGGEEVVLVGSRGTL